MAAASWANLPFLSGPHILRKASKDKVASPAKKNAHGECHNGVLIEGRHQHG